MQKVRAGVLLAVGVLLLSGCGGSTPERLTFEIGGSATSASITWITDNFGTSQATDASVPWTRTETYTSGTLGVNISAQNAGSGTITCKITDSAGKVLAQNQSSGDYAIVSCSVG